MPFRSKETLQTWLDEFARSGTSLAGSARVMEQDGSEGHDTGLIRVDLASAPTVTYIQPASRGNARWVVTFESRDEPAELDAAGVSALAAELDMVSALCEFLQAKSRATPLSETY